MKFKIFALSSVALACLSVTSQVAAEDEWLDVYGKINMTLDKVDIDNSDDQWELNSNASRFGIKGKGPAGKGIQAFYQIEWEVDMADGGGAGENIKSRNQIVGLRGDFGEVFAGRHDTPTKQLQKKIDLFGDLVGDIKHSFNAETRANNILQYTTPSMGAFKAKVAIVPGEATAVNDGLADGTSIALEYKAGDLNIGISLDSDIEGDGVDTTRIMAQYKMDIWQFGLMIQDTDNNGADGSGLMASVNYKLDGKNSLKAQLIESDVWEAGVSANVGYSSQLSLGWDHQLGKKTTLFTYLTTGEIADTVDSNIFGLGLVQKF